jgi:hypothetical protein
MISVGPDEALPAGGEAALQTFEEAVQQQLARLRQRLGLDRWILTRAAGSQWIVLQAVGDAGLPRRGSAFDGDASLCRRGLRRRDGRLIGILYGGDGHAPSSADPEAAHAAFLSRVAAALATLLEREFEIAHYSRLAQLALLQERAARPDWLDTAQWPECLAAEEQTRATLLSPASVLVVDAIDLAAAAAALRRALGEDCLPVRLAATQLAAVLPECDGAQAQVLQRRAAALVSEREGSARCAVATAVGGAALAAAAAQALQALDRR